VWCKLRPYYGRWFKRMLGDKGVVELAILFHDMSTLQRMSLRRSTHLGECVLFGGDAYAVARHMLSALRGSGTDSVRGEKVRSLMADMEKVTNILLNAERWNLR